MTKIEAAVKNFANVTENTRGYLAAIEDEIVEFINNRLIESIGYEDFHRHGEEGYVCRTEEVLANTLYASDDTHGYICDQDISNHKEEVCRPGSRLFYEMADRY